MGYRDVTEISKFQQVGFDNRKTETNRNDESSTFDEEREYRKVTENMRIMSISSPPILSANFHVPTFIMCQFLFPMFDSADRCLLTFLLKDNSFFLT